jgi:hypothetical protein
MQPVVRAHGPGARPTQVAVGGDVGGDAGGGAGGTTAGAVVGAAVGAAVGAVGVAGAAVAALAWGPGSARHPITSSAHITAVRPCLIPRACHVHRPLARAIAPSPRPMAPHGAPR